MQDNHFGPFRIVREFIRLEAAGGILLFVAAVLSLVIVNTDALEPVYNDFLQLPVHVKVGALELYKPLVMWVNDGMMAIFFLMVGLEIKREMLEGELSSVQRALLPCIAAVGGMAVPALIYVIFNYDDSVALHGWAIPTATDIAFALGILTLLGSRVPSSLKIFLTALAIMDDLGAIMIIALYYTAHLSWTSLALASFFCLLLIMLNRIGVTRNGPYIFLGVALWICVLKSGVHATLAGVALAFAIPLRIKNKLGVSPAQAMEHSLLPWVSFGVLPLFAFVNAGVDFGDLKPDILVDAVPLGIALGLLFGKQIGVFGACWLAVKTGIAELPRNATWSAIYGISLICGVGFTMSLFIGGLAFAAHGVEFPSLVRVGVLVGSTISGVLGYIILKTCCKPRPQVQYYDL